MKTFVLYVLKERGKEARYVGITCDLLKKRLWHHVAADGKNPHKKNWIQQVLRRGGELEIVPLAINLTRSEACSLEIGVIKELKVSGYPLTNIGNGGESAMFGRKHTEDTLKKMAEAKTGKFVSPETRQKISAALIGKKRPPFSEETRKKISKSKSGKNNPNFGRLGTFLGRRHSEESRRRMSESAKRRAR